MRTNHIAPAPGFSRNQIKKLVAKLDRRHVHERQIDGRTISYIEGWFAIAEANAIFGFDGWDRETVHVERVFEQARFSETTCAYTARVRIRVHAGDRAISREGTGFGTANARDRADAHEKAVKAAETDATKRALATFGNRFGLSLYNKDQAAPLSSLSFGPDAHPISFTLRGPGGEIVAPNLSAEAFCGGLRQLIEVMNSDMTLGQLRQYNLAALERLRQEIPNLKTARGSHFADVLERLFDSRSVKLRMPPPSATGDREAAGTSAGAALSLTNGKVDKSQLAIATEKRLRHKGHLLMVGAKPCLICGEMPSHAHHVTFAQPRGLSLKVSDEFTVPLCAVHHNLLHRQGSEAVFWRQHGIDPLVQAKLLWQETLAAEAR